MRLFLPVLLLSLSACGGDDGNSGSAPTPTPTPSRTPTAAERISALEQAGTIPALNRAIGMIPNDVNANGVRDDVDAYIAASAYPAAGKQALIQVAKSIQATLSVNIADPIAVNSAALAMTRGVNCVFSKATGEADPLPDEILRLQSITTNTRERLAAYMRFNKASDGSVSAAPVGDTCA